MEIFPASFMYKEQNDVCLKYETLSDLLNIILIRFKCLSILSTLRWDGNGKAKLLLLWLREEGTRFTGSFKLKWKILTRSESCPVLPRVSGQGLPAMGGLPCLFNQLLRTQAICPHDPELISK